MPVFATASPVPVRPGEHACCRFSQAADREQLAAAFVRDGLRRGNKVVYASDGDPAAVVSQLAARGDEIEPAFARGQLDVRSVRATYVPDGTFDVDRTLAAVRAEHARALADGYPAACFIGDLCGVSTSPGSERLPEYERRLAEVTQDGTLMLLCQYDGGASDAALPDIADQHEVDFPAELAAIGRCGYLSAALAHPGSTLRLAGELDIGSAGSVAELLATQDGHTVRLDLADLEFMDLAGLRALIAADDRHVAITAASRPVRRLLSLLGVEEHPRVSVAAP